MGRGQGRSKVISKSIGEQDGINDMFNQLLGDEKSLDIEIVEDKYNKLKNEIEKVYKLFESFKKTIYSKVLKDLTGINIYIKNIEGFIEDAKFIIPDDIPRENLISHYLSIKENKVIKDCIHICKNLIIYKKYIEDNENLSDNFIKSSKTKELQIFPFCSFDIKTIYFYNKIDTSVKKYLLIFLNMVYTSTYEIYNIITSPDIDISKFSSVIIESIKNAQKMIPRANKAFKKIEQSVELLQDNFSNYYRDMVESRSPETILTSFIKDVSDEESSTNGVDLELAQQFKRIAMFYRKRSSGKIKDPRINQIFELLDQNFAMLNVKDTEEFNSDDEKEEEINVDDLEDKKTDN
jgi:hypothetical protein